jgi:transcriptional regulator with XRE-family HTH domain
MSAADKLRTLILKEGTISGFSQRSHVPENTLKRIFNSDNKYKPNLNTIKKLMNYFGFDVFEIESDIKNNAIDLLMFSNKKCMGCGADESYSVFVSRHAEKEFGSFSQCEKNHFDVELNMCEKCFMKNIKNLSMNYSEILHDILKKNNKASVLAKHLGINTSTISRILNKSVSIKFIRIDVALELNMILMNFSKFGYYGCYDLYKDYFLGEVEYEDLMLSLFDEDELKDLIYELAYGDLVSKYPMLNHTLRVELDFETNFGGVEWSKDGLYEVMSAHCTVNYSFSVISGYPYFECEGGTDGQFVLRSDVDERYKSASLTVVKHH